MKKITLSSKEYIREEGQPTGSTYAKVVSSYTDTNNDKQSITVAEKALVQDKNNKVFLHKILFPNSTGKIWYKLRPLPPFADSVVLGGKRKTKRKRKTRSNR